MHREGHNGLPMLGPLGSVTSYSCMYGYMGVTVGEVVVVTEEFSGGDLVVGSRKKESRYFPGRSPLVLLRSFSILCVV